MFANKSVLFSFFFLAITVAASAESYQLMRSKTIKRLSDGAIFPAANGNEHYEKYKKWVAKGNKPLPYVKTDEEHNQDILNQMADLERNQAAAVRKAILSGDKTDLQKIDDEVRSLKSQLRNPR